MLGPFRSFQDIPQFSRAKYFVDAPWRGLPRWLELFSQNGQCPLDFDPPYQRGYVWNLDQKIAYLEYKMRGGMGGGDIFWNSPDFYCKPIQLVDGKQRVSTVLEFLEDEIPIFGKTFSEYEGSMNMMNPRFTMHVNDLTTELEVVEWYLGMNTGGSAHTQEDLAPALEMYQRLK